MIRPGKLDVLDFFSSGPCRQRPDMRTASGRVITTCEECDGPMLAGDCRREKVRAAIATQRARAEGEEPNVGS